jgi:predicted TIM-barrel fold metal-dependent hydrolase
VGQLRDHHIKQACVGSFDGLLHQDIAGVNARLAEECRTQGAGRLLPFGSINPTLPDWQEDVRRCAEVHKMAGVRLHPNYHGYTLAAPVFPQLLKLCERHELIVQLAVKMEDERTQHRLLRVAPVDMRPLIDVLKGVPKLKLVILNGLRPLRNDQLSGLAGAGRLTGARQVWFEIAMLEGVGGITQLLEYVAPDRILFGSHFPFFYLESALLKLRESELTAAHLEAIQHGNADKLLAEARKH